MNRSTRLTCEKALQANHGGNLIAAMVTVQLIMIACIWFSSGMQLIGTTLAVFLPLAAVDTVVRIARGKPLGDSLAFTGLITFGLILALFLTA